MTQTDFTLNADFEKEPSSEGERPSLSFGSLESQYQELFAESLEDGVITPAERERLDRVATNLGLDAQRLFQLEEAMAAAYESHHRRHVEDQSRPRDFSAAPFEQPETRGPASIGHVQVLLDENRRLRARIAELETLLEDAHNAISVEVDVARFSAAPPPQASPEDLWKLIRDDAGNPSRHADYRNACLALGDAEGAYLASAALFALGAANPEDHARYEASRPSGLVPHPRAFDQRTWQDTLVHPDEDAVTATIFALVARAVLVGRVTTLRRDRQLHVPNPETRQEAATSTIMAAKAAGWAATILGLPTPTLYIEKERSDAFLLNPGIPPATLVGRGALSGRTPLDLAFLAGRHLAGYRAEHFVRNLFPAPVDLEDIFLSALLIANPGLPLSGRTKSRVEPLAVAIHPLLESQEIDQLRASYQRFVEQGGRTNLLRFSQGTDRTAARAGLALSQDLPSALRILEEQEGPVGPIALDLLGFWMSPRHRAFRFSLQN